ncbi:MAG: molybdopterin-guanine dinucleotide biosynthesis protein B [Nitrospira bacterium HGW-Nitrospira-1]|nr:MAG: molybdopterin-guanine dinucleotide biosynthesis protein B [Nitrospira bacterium HGW-Nitrospira-1]
MNSTCIIGIAGYSGSGKTTLIEKILPELKKQGFCVGVLKHIHHKLVIDVKGKDTDRFYRAGANFVFAHDAEQSFVRLRYQNDEPEDVIEKFPSGLDLIIVEGHKEYDVPGIWLEKRRPKKGVPIDMTGEKKIIYRDDPLYVDKARSHIREAIAGFHAQRIIHAGLLIGGKSIRMGRPKALLKREGITLAERSFKILSEVSEKAMLLGSGQLPECLDAEERLPDIQGLHGPLAGILSAFRWAPQSAWIISSVDMPLMHKGAWEWLLNQRKPGIWAVLPKIRGSRGVETTGAVYEPMIFEYVESLARKGTMKLQEIMLHPKVLTPVIPKTLAQAWQNVNTAADWKRVLHCNTGSCR